MGCRATSPIPAALALISWLVVASCAMPTPPLALVDDSSRLPASQVEGGREGDVTSEFVPPGLARARDALLRRLSRAHERLGRGRPPATEPVLGELGLGAHQGFFAELRQGRCYTIIVVGLTDDQEVDLLLFDPDGAELGRDTGSGAPTSLDLCPTADGDFRVVVRMYAGQGPFALQVFRS